MRILKSETGMAMPLIMIVMVVLTLLGTALWQYSLFELRQVVHEENKTRAYYIARTGAESVALTLKRNPTDINLLLTEVNEYKNSTNNVVASLFDDNTDLEVLVEANPIENTVTITGIGTSNGVSQTVNILLKTGLFYEKGPIVVTSPTLAYFHGGSEVIGDIIAKGPVTLPSGYAHTLINGDKYPYPDDHFNPVDVPTVEGGKVDIRENNSDYTINSSMNIGELRFNNSTLRIDTGSGGDINLVIDVFYLKGDLVVEGSGTVRIYVLESATIQTPGDTLYPDGGMLHFYLTEGSEMTIQTSYFFNGLIYGPYDARLNLQAGPKLHGLIIISELSGQGSTIGGSDALITLDERMEEMLDDPGVEVVIEYWKP